MKDRLGSFGDVIFGLLLAGIVAAYVALFAHLLATHAKGPSAAFGITQLLWISTMPIFQFIVTSLLWVLQARVITRLYVDHFAFILAYLGFLYFLFGWSLIEGVVPQLVALLSFKVLPQQGIVGAGALLICACFCMLLVLACGGLAYHWFLISKFERYEAVRDCVVIGAGAVCTWAVTAHPEVIKTPVDLMFLIVLLGALRMILAKYADQYAVEVWGSSEQREHQERVAFAGVVLMAVLAMSLADIWKYISRARSSATPQSP